MNETKIKNILITNDDGYYAPGLLTLVEKLNESGKYNLYVAAPSKQQSGVGHGITLFSNLTAEKIILQRPILYSIPAYGVDGTPADCTKLALTNLFKEISFDLVISGINEGVNVGVGVLYSGTVSAALEACINKIPSIAVSLSYPKTGGIWHYDAAATKILEFLQLMKMENFHAQNCININFPNIPYKDLKGFMPTKQGQSNYAEYYVELEPFENSQKRRFQLEGEMALNDDTLESDYFAITQGYVSISVLSPFMHNLDYFNFCKWDVFPTNL